MDPQKIKKAAGYGLSGTAIVVLIVTFLLKDMLAWPGETDDKVNAHEVRITKVETVQEDSKEDIDNTEKKIDSIELEQKAMREDMNDGFNDLKDLIREGR